MCADQKQFKDILLVDMVSTPKGLANNSPISPMTSTPVKKARDRKSLCLFTNILDMKKNLLPVDLELLNLRVMKLNMVLYHGN